MPTNMVLMVYTLRKVRLFLHGRQPLQEWKEQVGRVRLMHAALYNQQVVQNILIFGQERDA